MNDEAKAYKVDSTSRNDEDSLSGTSAVVRSLRRRWKPIKEGEAAEPKHEPVRVRLHRCFSWMQRVEDLDAARLASDDARLIYGWIALNSLYGRWINESREPAPEWRSLEEFLRRLYERDADGRLPAMIEEHRRLARSIVGDEFLSRHYWKDPGDRTVRRAQNDARGIGKMIVERRHRAAIEETLERVYLARCQLVHGASTHEGELNRDAVRRSAIFLRHFLEAACVVIIDHAWRDDWGGLCYPPT